MLLIACFFDLRYRGLTGHLNYVWFVFFGIALSFESLDLLTGYSLLLPVLVSISITTFTAYTLYYFRIFGGADRNALILIGLMVPIFYANEHVYTITALITLTNSFLIMLTLPVIYSLYNLYQLVLHKPIFNGFNESLQRKLFAVFFGFKQYSLHSFYLPMQITTKSGEKFDFQSWQAEHYEGRANTWVTPQIPFMSFLVIAFFITIFYGDLLTPAYLFALHIVK